MKFSLLLLGLLMSGSLIADPGAMGMGGGSMDMVEMPASQAPTDAQTVPPQHRSMKIMRNRPQISSEGMIAEMRFNQQIIMKKLDRLAPQDNKELQRLRRENKELRAENRALLKALVRVENDSHPGRDSGEMDGQKGRRHEMMRGENAMRPGMKGRPGKDAPQKVEALKRKLKERSENAETMKKNESKDSSAPVSEEGVKNNDSPTPTPAAPMLMMGGAA